MKGYGFRHVGVDVGGAKGEQNWTLTYRQLNRAQATSLICLAEAPLGLCRLWVRVWSLELSRRRQCGNTVLYSTYIRAQLTGI